MAAVLARALCIPCEFASWACDACVASTACRSLGRACSECGGCADRFCAQFFNTRASAAVFFSTTIGLVPGVAGLIVALSNLGSAGSCRAGDGLAVTSLALQSWLIGQLVFALAGVATAFYIWAAFQRPFNLRDPRDKNWVARATYLCCYDPGVAVAMVAKLGQVAWLIIGSGMSGRAPPSGCPGTVVGAFNAILTIAWVYNVAMALGIAMVYCYECTCGAANEVGREIDRVVGAAAAAPAAQFAPQPHYAAHPAPYQQQQYQQQYAAAVVGAPMPAPAAAYAAPAGVYAAAQPAHVPVAVAVAAPPPGVFAAAPYAVPVATAVPAQHAQYPYGAQPPHSGAAAAADLARAGLGLLGTGLMAGARVTGAVVSAAADAARAEHARLQQQQQQHNNNNNNNNNYAARR